VRSHGEFFFELRADEESGVIDMLAGPTEDESQYRSLLREFENIEREFAAG
jgi:hypothetical protein